MTIYFSDIFRTFKKSHDLTGIMMGKDMRFLIRDRAGEIFKLLDNWRGFNKLKYLLYNLVFRPKNINAS
jgi:hypothetical protein